MRVCADGLTCTLMIWSDAKVTSTKMAKPGCSITSQSPKAQLGSCCVVRWKKTRSGLIEWPVGAITLPWCKGQSARGHWCAFIGHQHKVHWLKTRMIGWLTACFMILMRAFVYIRKLGFSISSHLFFLDALTHTKIMNVQWVKLVYIASRIKFLRRFNNFSFFLN